MFSAFPLAPTLPLPTPLFSTPCLGVGSKYIPVESSSFTKQKETRG